jgi:hypothetical protein
VAINVPLFRVSDQAVLWAETYEREIADLLDVQEDVARRVRIRRSAYARLAAALFLRPMYVRVVEVKEGYAKQPLAVN